MNLILGNSRVSVFLTTTMVFAGILALSCATDRPAEASAPSPVV